MKALDDYTDRCGSCKYYKATYKDGRITKMGKCDRRFKTSKHRASDKACLEYSTTQKSETEIWNSMHGKQIIAPKGTFKKIWEDAESEDKE